MPTQNYRVNEKAQLGLNLRSAPVVSPTNKITVLPFGHLVKKIADSSNPKWWQIATTKDGIELTGFVSKDYLTPATDLELPPASKALTPVHLDPANKKVTRDDLGFRAYPLNEANQPQRPVTGTADSRSKALSKIVQWLNVEAKKRYAPTTANTFCNIYAYDYCYLANAYLPRVWWTSSAIESLKKGKAVTPIYGQTVHELNANSLFRWLKDYGGVFGWQPTFDLTALQAAANSGRVALICAPNKIPNRSGHIVAVVPETPQQTATRNGEIVRVPLQSQAGRVNRAYFTQQWWTKNTFSDWGFWINQA